MLHKNLHSSLSSIEKDYLFEFKTKGSSKPKKNLFNGWVPNNSGLLRWERIGIGDVDGRISFNYSSCVNEDNNHKTIEILDTDIGIQDDIPGVFDSIKDYYRVFMKDPKYAIKYFKKNGFSIRAEPIFYSSIDFKNLQDNTNVKIGEGHKQVYGGYEGVASLCFYTKKKYNAICNDSLIKELKEYQKNIARSVDCKELDDFKKRADNLLKNNQPLYAYEVKYKVESKGRITIQPLNVLINPEGPGIDIQPLLTHEGYKHIIQLLFGLIKKVYHGDNHHHRKDDVILQVHETNASPLIILDQMASHIKGLEKIESKREKIPCNDFVPSYWHDAKGIQGYAKMYYKNYLDNEKHRVEGNRLLCAIDVLTTSMETSFKRHIELKNANESHRFSLEIFKNPSIWILLISFSSLMFTVNKNSESTDIKHDIAHNYVSNFSCIINELSFSFIATILLIVFAYSMRKWIKKIYCKSRMLHTDNRPKDKEAVKQFNGKTKTIIILIIIALFSITILNKDVKSYLLPSVLNHSKNIYQKIFSIYACLFQDKV